jgi:hypothetical protein
MPEASTTIEALDRRLDDLVAVRRRARTDVDGLDLGAEFLAIRRDLLQRLGAARRQHNIAASAGKHLRRERAERSRSAGDDRGLAFDVEERERIFQEVFGHDISTCFQTCHAPRRRGTQ